MLFRTRTVALVAAMCAATGAAHAASVVTDWSGVYAGIHAGYAWGRSDPALTYVPDFTSNSGTLPPPGLSPSGASGGVQAGYNAQIGRWVLGGEVDFSYLGTSASATIDPFWVTAGDPNNMTLTSRYDWLATARLRLGALVTPDLLIYVTGGLAMTRVQDYARLSFPTYPSTGTHDESRLLFGAAIGGGVEYALSPHWTVRGEYLYAAFDDVLPQWTTTGTLASPVSFSHGLGIARAGLNYRWDAPSQPAAASRAPMPHSWTGFYAGFNAGYAGGGTNPYQAGDSGCHLPANGECYLPFPSFGINGFIGGGQLGYLRQAGAIVLGAEVDFSGLGARGEATRSPLIAAADDIATFSTRYDWLATARLRVGVSPATNWLIYATGGLAVTRVQDKFVDSNLPFFGVLPYISEVTFERTGTLYGAAIGGGLEYAMATNWSVRLEYLHAAFNKTAPRTSLGGWPVVGFDHRLDIVRAGVNYRFN